MTEPHGKNQADPFQSLISAAQSLCATSPQAAIYTICDMLWLKRVGQMETESAATRPIEQPAAASSVSSQQARPPEIAGRPPSEPREFSGTNPSADNAAVPVSEGGRYHQSDSRQPLALRGAPALARKLPLERAFRAFRPRRMGSLKRLELDLDAIVERRIACGYWIALQRPRRDRWLELAVVTEQSATMRLWQPTCREFSHVAARGSAASRHRSFSLEWDPNSTSGDGARVVLREAQRQIGGLSLPSQRSVVLYLTDAFGPGWLSGAVPRQLAAWARSHPVLVIMLLPPAFWGRTSLRPLLPLRRLKVRRGRVATEHLPPAPLLSYVDPSGIAESVGLLGGMPGPGAMTLWRSNTDADRIADPEFVPNPPPRSELRQDLIDHIYEFFRQSATPETRQLARYLAHVPLVLPIMRLIERALVPGAAPWQLSELVMSGLLRRKTASSRGEEAEFEFLPGIQARLKKEGRPGIDVQVASALNDLPDRLNRYLARRMAQGEEFPVHRVSEESESSDGTLAVVPGLSSEALQVGNLRLNAIDAKPLLSVSEKRVACARFSPNGNRIATASRDKSASIWDTQTARRICGPLRHDGAVTLIEFGPEAKHVLTACDDGRLRVWDCRYGRLEKTAENAGYSRIIHIDRRGRRIAAVSTLGTATVWNIDGHGIQAQLVMRIPNVLSAQFSPDGERLLTADTQGSARQWVCSSRKSFGDPMVHRKGILFASYNHLSSRLVTAGMDSTAQLWDPLSCKKVGAPMNHDEKVHFAVFSPDDRLLATASADGIVKLWDGRSGLPVLRPLKYGTQVQEIAFSRDSRRFLAVDAEHRIFVHSAATGALLGNPVNLSASVHSAEFSPESDLLLTSSGDGLARLWDIREYELPNTPPGSELAQLHSPTNAPDRTAPLEEPVPESKSVRLFGRSTLAADQDFQSLGTPVALDVETKGSRAATVRGENSVDIWRLGGTKLAPLKLPHPDKVNSVKFSSDGTWLATACRDGNVRIWHARLGKLLGAPLEHPGAVVSANFKPHSYELVTACTDGVARVWLVPSGRLINQFRANPKALTFADFSRGGGDWLVTAGTAGLVRVWHSRNTLEPRHSFAHQGRVNRAQVSPDGRLLISAGEDHHARIWALESGNQAPIHEFVHNDSVIAAEFAQDGSSAATVCKDGDIRLWDVATGELLRIFRVESPTFACFSHDAWGVVVARHREAPKVVLFAP